MIAGTSIVFSILAVYGVAGWLEVANLTVNYPGSFISPPSPLLPFSPSPLLPFSPSPLSHSSLFRLPFFLNSADGLMFFMILAIGMNHRHLLINRYCETPVGLEPTERMAK